MALTWDVSNIANHQTVTTHPDDLDKLIDGKIPQGADVRWSPTTDSILMIGMVIGIGTITEKNWRTYWMRAHAYETMFGAYHRKYASDGKSIVDVPLTVDDVKAHIGLRTNVSEITDAQFSKKLLQWAKEIGDEAIKRAELKKEADPIPA